jgi:hypothetical protein
MLPKAAGAAIQVKIPFRFSTSSHVPRAWKGLHAPPETGDPHPERTREEFCSWDWAHGAYAYPPKFVEPISDRVNTAEGFKAFLGLEPRPKAQPAAA